MKREQYGAAGGAREPRIMSRRRLSFFKSCVGFGRLVSLLPRIPLVCPKTSDRAPLAFEKMNMPPLSTSLRVLFATAAIGGSVARADLLSTESFSGFTVGKQIQTAIPSSAVAGYTGDWTGVDFGAAKPTAFLGSLVYSDPRYLPTGGDKVGVLPNTSGGEITANNSGRVYRLLDNTLKVTDSTVGTRYLSFLFVSGQQTGATTYQMLSLYDGGTADAARNFDVGVTTNGGLAGTQYNFGVDNSYTNTGVTATTAVRLVVVKFSLSATAAQDSVTVWVDPVLGAGEPAGGTTVTGKNITFDRLALSDYDGNSAGWDEIRWATTFDEATLGPVPPTSTPAPGTFVQDAQGVTLETATGFTRVEVWAPGIFRVVHAPLSGVPAFSSLTVNTSPATTAWTLNNDAGWLTLSTAKGSARLEIATGRVIFADPGSTTWFAEASGGTSLQPTTIGAFSEPSRIVRQNFSLPAGEAIYGFGQQQDGAMNQVGRVVTLLQENMKVGVPVWLSNKGYAVLWDNPAVTTADIGSTTPGTLSVSSEAGKAVDYYFFAGPTPDQAIAGYRALTGAAPMFAKWAWGFWQSKERYQSAQELIDVVDQYRSRSIPIDGIIQDWQYWPALNQSTASGGWGSHEFDPTRYPDPAALTAALHARNIHALISVWAKFDVTNSGVSIPNLQALDAIGGAYSPPIPYVFPAGQGKWYDPFNAAARQIYWSQLSQKIFARGWDGWWLDASEAELSGKWGEFRNFETALGSGAKFFNAYPLMHTSAVYAGQRAETSQKRAIILTRSAYAGQQRNAAITWSGDINGQTPGGWSVFAKQIPAGLNFVSTGIPYWNTDIGGFGSSDPANAAYAELFTRWLQFGAFCPMFRVHGTDYAKEVWRFPAATQPVLIDYIKLRYQLFPYIYSTAWRVTDQGYTMMRPLVMDFPADSQAANIPDQFMFGPALLVNPVTSAGASTRQVYLPAGATWYDFWTGDSQAGGATIAAAAPIQTIPLYVRAGSILPMGPTVQHTAEAAGFTELRVYPGADGSFSLYDDEGDNYGYESGARSTISLSWNDSTKVLTIGARQGSFPGMSANRVFRVVFARSGRGAGLVTGQLPDVVVNYDGTAVNVAMPPLPELPPAPTGLSATLSSGRPLLTWSAVSSGGEVLYGVRRAVQAGGSYAIVADNLSATQFIDTGALPGTSYHYVVFARNVAGVGPVSTSVVATAAGNSLQAHLSFNEAGGATAADARGHAGHGPQAHGPARLAGRGGNAVSLDGVNDHVSLPTGVVGSLNNFTITFWTKLDALADGARLFDFGTGTSNYMRLTARDAATGALRFAITTTGAGAEQRVDGAASVPTGAWTHVAITVGQGLGVLYVNGVETGRNAALSLTPLDLGSTTQNWIGRSQSAGDPYLGGQVDDFRIYGGALSASEVQALANGPAGALRVPWSSQDIGSTTLAGSAASTAPESRVALTASGADIFGASDNFHYAYRSWTGDGALTARISGVTAADPWTKVGIMFRESLTANAPNILLAVTPSNGCTVQYRSSAGGATSWSAVSGVAAPQWLRLVRAGNVFTSYRSADGATWTQVGSPITLALPSAAYLGLALTSHNNAVLAAAQFDEIAISDPALVAPAGLSAGYAAGQVSLAWQSAAGAQAYNVKRAGSAAGPFTAVARGVATTNYADTVAADGTTYYYVVSSVNGEREGPDSAPVSISALSAYQQWKLNAGLSVDTPDTATPDGDGLPIILKYALNLPLGTPEPAPTELSRSGAGDLVFAFERRSPAPVTYVVQSSTDLVTWTDIATCPAGGDVWSGSATVAEQGSGASRTVAISVPLSGQSRRFLRVRIVY